MSNVLTDHAPNPYVSAGAAPGALSGMPSNSVDPASAARISAVGRSVPGCIPKFELLPNGKEIVTILMTGDSKSAPSMRVTDHVRAKFALEYNAWKSGTTSLSGGGTPLEHWARVTRAQVTLLNASNCYTVEDVANIPDASLPNLGVGGTMLRQHAQEYIQQRTQQSTADETRLAIEQMRQDLSREREARQAAEERADMLMQSMDKGQLNYAGVEAANRPSPPTPPYEASDPDAAEVDRQISELMGDSDNGGAEGGEDAMTADEAMADDDLPPQPRPKRRGRKPASDKAAA